MADLNTTVTAAKPELLVLSDIHLGEGLQHEERRFSPTEDFFYDETFARLLAYLKQKYSNDPDQLVLVLNGDIFDFLTVTHVPDAAEAERRGFTINSAEVKFGLNPTASKSVYKLDIIAAGHQPFFRALASLVAAGHRIEIIRGNHDLELFFPEVRDRVLLHLAGFEDGPDLGTVRRRVRFHEWFYFEPGRVYIEHGHQYDSTNSTRYPLRPVLSNKQWWSSGEIGALDYPLGSIFVRFFYNRVRRFDPYTPRLLSFEQYLGFIRRYNLFDLWRVYRDHYPHFVAALGPATTTGSAGPSSEDDAQQERDFQTLEESLPHGHLYRKLAAIKNYPASASKPAMVKAMIRPIVRRFLWFSSFSFIALFVWLLLLQLIDRVEWLTANVFLMSLFSVTTVGVALWAFLNFQRRQRRHGELSGREHVQAAERIAEITSTPLVLMGHSHIVDYRTIRGGTAVYANSGTWTSVDNPWARHLRDARRLTCLHVMGDEVEIVRWNDDALRFDTVPMFYLEEEHIAPFPTVPGEELRSGGEHSWLPSAAIPTENDDDDFSPLTN